MADTFTPFLNLVKPDPNTEVDIGDINGNMDLIDAAIASSNTIATIPPDSGVGAYPSGMSMFRLVAADMTTYPNWVISYAATSATVLTFKPASDRAVQMWFRNGSIADGLYRSLGTSANTPWREFSAADSCALNSVADVSVPDNTWQRMSETVVETQHGYNAAYSNGGVLIRFAGLYRVEITCAFNGSAGGTSIVYLGFGQLNDAGPSAFYRVTGNPGTGSGVLNGSWTKSMAVNDTVYIFANHVTGAAKIFNTRRLVVNKISPAP